MVDIALNVLDAQGPSGAQFVANNAKGAAALACLVDSDDSEVTVGQVVRVDGWMYKHAIAKLRALDVTVLNYTALKDW